MGSCTSCVTVPHRWPSMWAKWKFGPHMWPSIAHGRSTPRMWPKFQLSPHGCKNKLVVLTTEWLPWLLSSWRWYMRYLLLVLETNCTRRPERQLPSSSYKHNTVTTLRTSLRESPACIRSVEVPYCKFEVYL